MPQEDAFSIARGRVEKARLPGGNRSRFIAFAEVNASTDSSQSFHYGSYYAHCIGNAFFHEKGFDFILSNGFLASHAYNLALVLLHYRGSADGKMARALAHNFKKFYAECALFKRNCLIGRALLIETLAYEQDLMIPVFAAAEADAALATRARLTANVMSSLLSGHELSHYFQRQSPDEWIKEFGSLYGGTLGHRYEEAAAQGHADSAVELVCDAVGAFTVWRPESDYSAEIPDHVSRLRICALGFLCFGELLSLQRSAWTCADRSVEDEAAISLGSELRPQDAFSLWRNRDKEMDERVATIIDLLEQEAERLGGSLFDHDDWIPLDQNTKALLQTAYDSFDDILEEPVAGLSGTTLQRRQMAQLIAESLHGHPHGADHLLWRSKRFTVGGQPVDP